MTKTMLTLFAFVLCLGLTAPVGAVDWDLVNSFPDDQGPTFFAFAYDIPDGTPNDGTYRQLVDGGSYRFDTPGGAPPPYNWDIPYVSKSGTDWLALVPSETPQCAGRVFPPENAVLAFKVPFSGPYDITGVFRHTYFGYSDGTDVYVLKNSEVLWNHTYLYNESQSFSLLNQTLQKDDYIYFSVNAKTSDYADTTYLQGRISGVPLPGAVWLLGSGLLGLIGLRRLQR